MKRNVVFKETIDLKVLKHFLAVAKVLSFTQASQALLISKSALSKDIMKLEADIGAKVFDRSSRVVRLTETGQILYRRAEALLEDAGTLLDDLRTMQENVSGHLKIAAPPALGRFLSKAIIPQFLAQWPEVSVSLKLSYEYENLFAEGLDLAFRMGKNRDDKLIEKPLGQANRVIVASPDYLSRHPKISHPRDLLVHSSVQFYAPPQQTWALHNGLKSEHITLHTAFQCADFAAIVNAVMEGAGVAQLPWLLVREHVKAGQLVHVLPQWLSSGLPISLVYREGYNKPPKLAEFLTWIERNKEEFDLRFRANRR